MIREKGPAIAEPFCELLSVYFAASFCTKSSITRTAELR